jgi:hypothetical protein
MEKYIVRIVIVILMSFFIKYSLENFANRDYLNPPNKSLCLHPYLFCGVKTGGNPGENWCLQP